MLNEFKLSLAERLAKRAYRLKLRLETLFHYSNGEMACACCGEDSVAELCIDHIEGDGKAHRIRIFGRDRHISSDRMYSWLKKNGWPKGFQVLCMMCNILKSDTNKCPCGGTA